MTLVLRDGKWYDKQTGKLDKEKRNGIQEILKAKKFPSVSVEAGYDQTVSPIDGHVFKSKRDHSEYMKKNNLVVKEDTKEDKERRRNVYEQQKETING